LRARHHPQHPGGHDQRRSGYFAGLVSARQLLQVLLVTVH
jgi:hypothetical protein